MPQPRHSLNVLFAKDGDVDKYSPDTGVIDCPQCRAAPWVVDVPPAPASTGWKCPVCGRGNAPWVRSCECQPTSAKPKVEPPPGRTYPA